MKSKMDDLAARLDRLRDWMMQMKLDGFIVPRADAHQSEVTAPRDDCLAYLTGFTGSAGLALVLRDKALLFVDGRYQVQARGEVDPDAFELHHLRDEPIDRWFKTCAMPGWRIGCDAMKITSALHDRLNDGLARRSAVLVSLDSDPFDLIWKDRPQPPLGRVRAMPVEHAGEASLEKRRRIAVQLRAAGADFLVEAAPDNVAWLLNVRGSDVEMNPVPQSFLIMSADGAIEWFVDQRKLGNDSGDLELDGVRITPPSDLLERLTLISAGKTAMIDAEFAPQALCNQIAAAGGAIVACDSPILRAKAVKTKAELEGYRTCHLHDGIAMTNFLAWVSAQAIARQSAGRPLTELEAEAQLLAFRRAQQGFLEPSFRTISAAGANAAMCHYAAKPATNAIIDDRAPYLVDSGGQYLTATTDLTRTLMLGCASEDMRDAYTAVLKGFLSLLSLRFPVGTQGHQIDAFARRALWDIGLDYDHGTGHGVGHNLLLHEYPHRLDKRPNLHGLEPGNIMTIEPGYYKEGAFGMRIENQVEVAADGPGFCRFESLTLVPIDLEMARLERLSAAEVNALDTYHARVRATLKTHVRPEALPFLMEQTRQIGERRWEPSVMDRSAHPDRAHLLDKSNS